jgi:hypothetical protein
VSLHTIVSDSIVGRRAHRRAAAPVARPRMNEMAVLLSGASMRVLETALAGTAIVVALLLNLGR